MQLSEPHPKLAKVADQFCLIRSMYHPGPIAKPNMRDVEEVCDRILFLHAGKILASGTAEEIKQRFQGADLDEVFIKVARNEAEALRL